MSKPAQPQDHADRRSRPPYSLSDEKKKKGFKTKYSGSCFCGNVKIEVDQDPLQAMYCHCSTCKKLHGATYQWAAVYPKDAVHFVSGEDNLHFYSPNNKEMKYSLPCKLSCGSCQSPIADEGKNMFLLFPGVLDEINDKKLKDNGPFKGQYHMFYGARVEDVSDGLPKYLGKQGEQLVDDHGNKLSESENPMKNKKDDEEGDGDANKKQKKD